MGNRRSFLPLGLCILVMGLLILDSGCAARSAAEAIDLCLRTVAPSLFPMLALSIWLTPRLSSLRVPWLARLLKLPQGGEGFFLLGLVGGFPTGAAVLSQAVSAGSLDRASAQRMLGFCNNCAPAFLFGILGTMLGDPRLGAAVLVIQALAAMTIGMLWPGGSTVPCVPSAESMTLPQAVRKAVSGLVNVCAWVVLASVVTGFLNRWLFPLLPGAVGVILTGLLELTGGCLVLAGLPDPGLQFTLGCFFVSFGGISVLAQIHAFAAQADISVKSCVLQKFCQGLLAAILGVAYLRFGFSGLAIGGIFPLAKKTVEIWHPLVYNTPSKGGI